MAESARSLAGIDETDLRYLAGLAAEAEAGLFARNPHGAGRYAGRLLCRALCQGAALHYLDGRTMASKPGNRRIPGTKARRAGVP
jgi:hypothetical protein